MAAQFKLTIKRGQRAPDIVRSAGTAISGSDAVEINVDYTNMSKLDFIMLLRQVGLQVQSKGWPQ